jgi:hypothetical protein
VRKKMDVQSIDYFPINQAFVLVAREKQEDVEKAKLAKDVEKTKTVIQVCNSSNLNFEKTGSDLSVVLFFRKCPLEWTSYPHRSQPCLSISAKWLPRTPIDCSNCSRNFFFCIVYLRSLLFPSFLIYQSRFIAQ